MLHIILLSRAAFPYHPFGGMEQAVFGTASGLAELGYEIELFTARPLPGWEERAKSAGEWPPPFKVRFFPYRLLPLGRPNSIPDRLANYPIFALRLGFALARSKHKPDLVYCQGLSGLGYAVLKAGKAGWGPLVLNPQGMEELKVREKAKRRAYAPFNFLLRFTARRAARVIATDTPQITEVQNLLNIPAERVALAPNAVDLLRLDRLGSDPAVASTIKARFNPAGNFLLLSVGRLEVNKGLEVGLEAFRLARLPENWRWVIVGQGSQKAALEARAEKAGLLNRRVFFAGSLSDPELHALYQQAELFFHPTLYEGSSLVTLEAMAHRLPVIASATGGLTDKIQVDGPSANGQLCSPGNALELSRALNELAALSPDQRKALGEAGRRLVEANYSRLEAARKLSGIFEKLVG